MNGRVVGFGFGSKYRGPSRDDGGRGPTDERMGLQPKMAPKSSKWWQAPADKDLDYGFDSDDWNDRFDNLDRSRDHARPRQNLRGPQDQEAQQARDQDQGRGVFGNMSSWLQRQAGSQSSQLATTAVLSGAAVASAIFGYQAYRRKEAVTDLHSLRNLELWTIRFLLAKRTKRSAALARRAQQGDYDDDLILEQLARNRVFLGEEGLAKLRSSFVVVVGCGGVGSHAAASLARSGVSKIRLIDFDQVTLSSLNRHALATLADVGTSKVHTIRRRLEQIAPWVMFDCRNELYGKEASESLLGPWTLTHDGEGRRPDFVLDCIDNITSKVDLLHYCHTNSLPVISSMGAGCKSDPTRVVVGDISASTDDPLSRSTRRRLKLLGVTSGITAVFSTEKPGPGKASLLPLAEEEFAKGQVGELGVLPDFRVRILPVLGTMPAVFGYTVANHVICSITGYPIEYNLAGKGRDKVYDSMLSSLQSLYDKFARQVAGEDSLGLRLTTSKDDVAFLVEEDVEKDGQVFVPVELKDLVLMTKDEAARHEREVLREGKKPEEIYDETALQRVALRRREMEEYEKYRG
ncbi:hypothetical protein N7468_003491 [Penicillium chermesinum]|uniref:THIF-type NAD/FAD binding fold domain-containing protein n=1 Tax=Penicillium chermesinum TaxID=63820 RepID=A0A9W9P9C3_9EURO|nr:uncharacterized protein N7468_003491 [Penicillium chermesinum]KAJ5238872.1 hypothetical protein N7468_003491 [Penicillium chermesinum]